MMFAVHFDDARTAYLWIEGHGPDSDDRVVGRIARERQQEGALPQGNITSIKRVR
jgi:hypothetical protein